MAQKNYIIEKYKPQPRYFYHPNPYQSSIYSLMMDRGYEVIGEIQLEEKVKSCKVIVNDYLERNNCDDAFYYVYYVKYPKGFQDEKYLIIFGKKCF